MRRVENQYWVCMRSAKGEGHFPFVFVPRAVNYLTAGSFIITVYVSSGSSHVHFVSVCIKTVGFYWHIIVLADIFALANSLGQYCVTADLAIAYYF